MSPAESPWLPQQRLPCTCKWQEENRRRHKEGRQPHEPGREPPAAAATAALHTQVARREQAPAQGRLTA